MTSVRPGRPSWATCGLAAAVAVMLHGFGAAPAGAAISAVGDPPFPASPGVFTTDPLAVGVANGNRGIDDTRMLRQTFKNAATFDVGQVVVAFDVTGQPQGGMTMRFYEVEDVNATTWLAGNLVKELVFFGNLPGSSQRLGFDLSGPDVFTLPARNTGTQGYGIEFSNIDGASNTGVLFHTNVTDPMPTDLYADGVFYIENGTQSGATRDLGVALAVAGPQLAPGDVDGLNGVDLTDLSIIAANFRINGNRSQGDLTGNGFIDLADFREWKANYPGANSGSGAFDSLFGVPEPVTAVLLVVGLLGGCLVVARRRAK